jgi:flagellin
LPVLSGYGLTNLSDTVSLNLDRSQGRLQTEVSRLSSGLRINSAADDPSGLAIAEGLRSKVNGYDQAVSNVQDATNALTVADGALQTVTDLLQRLRVLTVQANHDLLSTDDRSNIQAESTQLQSEINTIAENTNFNGVSLLNRNPSENLVATPPLQNGTFTVPVEPSAAFLAGPVGGWTYSAGPGGFDRAGVLPSNFAGTGAFNSQPPPSGSSQMALIQSGGKISQSIGGFEAGVAYTLSFNVAQDGGNQAGHPESVGISVDGVQIAAVTQVPSSWADPNWTIVTTPSFVPGAGTHTISLDGLTTTDPNEPVAFIDNVQITATLLTKSPKLLQIHSGADEGDVTGVDLPTVATTNLGIASNTVASSASAALYETKIDSALDYVDGARATLGAEMVRLQYQAQNDETAAVNLTGSESNIRDLDIAATTTAFVQNQILSSIGTSVLANIKTQASLVEKLFQ